MHLHMCAMRISQMLRALHSSSSSFIAGRGGGGGGGGGEGGEFEKGAQGRWKPFLEQ